jgi:hypothetical protein
MSGQAERATDWSADAMISEVVFWLLTIQLITLLAVLVDAAIRHWRRWYHDD